jgi:hypothetical protein
MTRSFRGVREVVLLLDLGDPRGRDAEELHDIADRQPGRPKLGDRGRCLTVRSVAELSQLTAKREDLKGLVGRTAVLASARRFVVR